jgi:hypothetical protein
MFAFERQDGREDRIAFTPWTTTPASVSRWSPWGSRARAPAGRYDGLISRPGCPASWQMWRTAPSALNASSGCLMTRRLGTPHRRRGHGDRRGHLAGDRPGVQRLRRAAHPDHLDHDRPALPRRVTGLFWVPPPQRRRDLCGCRVSGTGPLAGRAYLGSKAPALIRCVSPCQARPSRMSLGPSGSLESRTAV